jgi:hypothetical protein
MPNQLTKKHILFYEVKSNCIRAVKEVSNCNHHIWMPQECANKLLLSGALSLPLLTFK